MAQGVLLRERLLHPDIMPILIVLTDGAGNVAIGEKAPQQEAYDIAEEVAEAKFKSVVINMEHAAFDLGLAQHLSEHLKAPCYSLGQLKAESLYHTVRQEMTSQNSR